MNDNNNKVSLSDLIEKLSLNSGLSLEECDSYFRCLFSTIIESLEDNETIKINGLGTFKILKVNERKSVDVQTGKENLIPSHNKICFIPDKNLKDDVNKPYSHLQTYILNNDSSSEVDTMVTKNDVEENDANSSNLSEECLEERNSNNDEKDSSLMNEEWFDNWEIEYSNEESSKKDDDCEIEEDSPENSDCTKDGSIPSEVVVEIDKKEKEPETLSNQDLNPLQPTSNVVEKTIPIKKEPLEKPTVEDPFKNLQTKEKRQEKNSTIISSASDSIKGKRIAIGIFISILFLIIGVIGINYLDPNLLKSLRLSDDNPPVLPSDTTSIQQEISYYNKQKEATDSASTSVDSVNTVKQISKDNVTIDNHFDNSFLRYMKSNHSAANLNVVDVPAKIEMKPGSRLTLLALKNYGNKIFWVYIYLYNKSKIDNPDNVKVGTVLDIPKFDKSLVNAGSKESVDMASDVLKNFIR